jgi:hypothetical protein
MIFICPKSYLQGSYKLEKVMENEIFLEKSWNFDFRENVMENSWKIRKHHAKSLWNGKTFLYLF